MDMQALARKFGFPPLVEARERTGRDLALTVEAGQFTVQEVTDRSAMPATMRKLTQPQSKAACAEFLRAL